jgi:hypothetical protein
VLVLAIKGQAAGAGEGRSGIALAYSSDAMASQTSINSPTKFNDEDELSRGRSDHHIVVLVSSGDCRVGSQGSVVPSMTPPWIGRALEKVSASRGHGNAP